ncbi:Alpha-ketoglutarate permease [Klebsiella pneumoniae]|nr:Alpha-ketoglutarate permease [Klebsiella pneumoniae]
MQNLTTREKFSELGRAATLLYTNRNILLSSMVRIINTLSLFGFAVIMPMMFVDELGFSTSEWLRYGQSSSPPFSLTCGDPRGKLGWMKVVRWFGCIGMALSSPAFYYIPQHFGHSFAMALIPAIALGIFVAAFVPLAAGSRRWSRSIKARPFRSITLSAGMSNFRTGDCRGAAAVLQHHRGGDRLYRIVRGGLFPLRLYPRGAAGVLPAKQPPASRLNSRVPGMRFMPALMR